MEFSELGKTGLKISRLAFGCASMGGYDYGSVCDEDSIKAVHAALDLGVNFFDTADIYGLGHAEEVLGRALRDKRGDAVIATKFGLKWDQRGNVVRDNSPRRVVQALDDSLRRLRLDVIDLYQIHWPDPKTPLQDTIEALLVCKETGKIRYLGCSNFSKDLIGEAQKHGRMESVQASFNLLDHKAMRGLSSICMGHGMSFIAHSTLARGFLTGKYYPGHVFSGSDTRKNSAYFSEKKTPEKLRLLRTMKRIAEKHGKSCTQVAVRWTLDNPEISSTVVGVKNVNQLEDNCGALGWTLPEEDFRMLSEESQVIIVEDMEESLTE